MDQQNEPPLPEDAEINRLDQWVNLINGRITDNRINNDVRNRIIEQYENNINQLKRDLILYRLIENRNRLMILPADDNQRAHEAQEMAANELNVMKNLILSQGNMVTEIDRRIDAAIVDNQGGRRRVRKSSSRPRGSRSSKKRGTQRKPKRRQRRGSRRA